MSEIVDEHRRYLSDPVRIETFAAAIERVVRPGDIVLDLGTGTGILAMLACRAGARRVYAVEAEGTIEIARAVAAANGLADRIVFVHGHFPHVTIPEQVNVLTSDLIGRLGIEAGLFELYEQARKWLAPGARTIPAHVTIAATAVEHEEGFRQARFWSEPVAGIAFDPVLRWSMNMGYPYKFDPRQLLSGERVSATFPAVGSPPFMKIGGDVTIARHGTLHGLAGWFSAELAPGVTLTNDPAGARLDRRGVYLPIERPLPVEPGDRVSIALRMRPAETLVRWDVAVTANAGTVHESHSTLDGMLLTREDLRTQDPACRPRLTERGQARATVLALCDGGRALEEIESEVHARHAALFPTRGDAEVFVAEVVSRYAVLDPA